MFADFLFLDRRRHTRDFRRRDLVFLPKFRAWTGITGLHRETRDIARVHDATLSKSRIPRLIIRVHGVLRRVFASRPHQPNADVAWVSLGLARS